MDERVSGSSLTNSEPFLRRRRGPQILASVIFLVALGAVAQCSYIVAPALGRWPAAELDLAGTWEARQMRQIHQATLEVAHDLRTPLAGLRMACDHLAAQPDDRALVETVVKSFSEQADRIFRLTDSILRSSKELSSTLQLNCCKVDLVEFIQSVVKEFRTRPVAARITVVTDMPAVPVVASIDLFQFRRALDNILINAAEACAGQDDARVTISLKTPTFLNPATEIIISDNGPGIPESVLRNLFAPFVSSGNERGIGLGLAATKRLIEAHGGTVQSVLGQQKGASFCIRIPV